MKNEDWKLKKKDVIMLLLPIEGEEKYIIAKWIVEDEPVETLKDAIIELPEHNGEKPKLKYPIVMVRDIDQLKEKLIKDIKKLEYNYDHSLSETNGIEGYLQGFDEAKDRIEFLIKERFGVEE